MAERPSLSCGLAPADRGKIETPAALLAEWYGYLAHPGLPAPRVHEAAFGPFTVEARFYGFTSESAYGHALRPSRSRGQPPALTIDILAGAACGIPRPRLAWRLADFGPKQIVPGWSDRDCTTYLLRSEGGVAIASWADRRAVIWLPSAEAVPWYERAAPFRALFDTLATRLDMTTLHAAVIGRSGAGVLLAGRGGAGKSTLALACVGHGFDYVSDDYCLLSLHPEPRAYNLYNTAKWKKDAVVVPEWLTRVVPDALDRDQQKNILRLDVARPHQLADMLTLRAIVLPAATESAQAVLESIPPQLALRHLAASTLVQSAMDGAGSVELMGRLVRAVPAFRLSMPRDPDRSVAAIASLLADVSGRGQVA
jgi:hypothetical protein